MSPYSAFLAGGVGSVFFGFPALAPLAKACIIFLPPEDPDLFSEGGALAAEEVAEEVTEELGFVGSVNADGLGDEVADLSSTFSEALLTLFQIELGPGVSLNTGFVAEVETDAVLPALGPCPLRWRR